MVIAIIPIKTNNQRLPGKNTKILGKHPLYYYMFSTIKDVCNIDKVCINSSDENILKISKNNNFYTLKRPIELNSSKTSGHDLLNYEINNLKLDDDDIIVQLFVTQPFIKTSTIESAINLLKSNPSKTSVLSLFKVENRFWYNDKPISHNPKLLQGTQYQKPIYCEAGFYTFKVGAFKKEKSRVTKNFIKQIVDPNECIDIDNKIDFNLAEVMLNEY